MRRAGDVCFSQVFRDRGGELIKFLCPFILQIHGSEHVLFSFYVLLFC